MLRLWISLVAVTGCVTASFALEPPERGHPAAAVDPATFGNHRLSEDFQARAAWKLEQARREALARRSGGLQPKSASIPPEWTGLSSTGEVQVLALLCDFEGQRAAVEFPGMTRERVHANLFGTGTAEAQAFYPRESLRNYYARASNDRLTVSGTTLGWYHFSGSQEDYKGLTDGDDRNKVWELTREILEEYDASTDYSQFDNDGDGVVDALNVIWVGERGPWSSFWWGYRWTFEGTAADDFVLDGVRFQDFSWQWAESREEVESDYDPRVIIHEFGHLLGLPDLYDYYPAVGPEGGVGGFDVMDSSRGANHNAFFRWILGWIEPEVRVVGETLERTLPPSSEPGTTGNAIVVLLEEPDGAAADNPFSEALVVEYRKPVANDLPLAEDGVDGLAVWHVAAALNGSGSDFANDNSATTHKLLRLVQADGLEDIEVSAGDFDAGDFFTDGMALGPGSPARNGGYQLAPSRFQLDQISIGETSASFRIGAYDGALLQASPGELQLIQPPGVEHPALTWTLDVPGAGESVSFPSTVFTTDGVVTETLAAGTIERSMAVASAGLGLGVHREVVHLTSPTGAFPDVHLPVQTRVRIPLEDALGLYGGFVRTGRHQPWIGQTEEVVSPPFAAASGIIEDEQQAFMTAYVVAPATLRFRWKVSSEQDHDFLRLQIDGKVVEEISGEQGWTQVAANVPGNFEYIQVQWVYAKDDAGSAGLDRAWIDDVVVDPLFTTNFENATSYYGYPAEPEMRLADGRTLLEHFALSGASNPFAVTLPAFLDYDVRGLSVPMQPERSGIALTLQGSLDGKTWYSILPGDMGFPDEEAIASDAEIFVPYERVTAFRWYRLRYDVVY